MLELFFRETERQIIIMKRYWVNGIVSLGTIYLTFILGYAGIANLAPNAGIKDSFLENYLLWVLGLTAFQGVSYKISEERVLGTIQQFFLSRQGILGWLFITTIVQFVFGFFEAVVFGWVASISVG